MPIGKLPSEIVLDKLRNIAINGNQGILINDKELETLLGQHFGSQRFAVKRTIKPIYGDHGYDEEINIDRIILDGVGDEELPLMTAIEYLNRPCNPVFAAKKIASMKSVMASRAESNNDIAISIDVISARLERYPQDIVGYFCEKVIDTRKWFPDIPMMIKELDELVSFRRKILEAFERCRNPLLSNNQKRLSYDLPKHENP